jgi:hypothetical protein
MIHRIFFRLRRCVFLPKAVLCKVYLNTVNILLTAIKKVLESVNKGNIEVSILSIAIDFSCIIG